MIFKFQFQVCSCCGCPVNELLGGFLVGNSRAGKVYKVTMGMPFVFFFSAFFFYFHSLVWPRPPQPPQRIDSARIPVVLAWRSRTVAAQLTT